MFILCLTVGVPQLARADATRSERSRAIAEVRHFIHEKQLFKWSQNQRCLAFIIGNERAKYFDVEVRVNNAVCGGDPNVMPMVMMFQVSRGKYRVECFGDGLDEPTPCERTEWFRRERQGRQRHEVLQSTPPNKRMQRRPRTTARMKASVTRGPADAKR